MEFIDNITMTLIVGFLADLLIGDPRWMYHPVRLIGKLIEVSERCIRRIVSDSPKSLMIGGGMMVCVVVVFSFAVPYALLRFMEALDVRAVLVLESFMCYQILAVKSLRVESMKVYDALERGTLEDARYAVSMIVGRDTKELDRSQVAKAAVETVAENTSDGTVAPMFFMALGIVLLGHPAPMGFLYKGINTMDSMVGYKNDTYLYFGRAAAKLDDLANYLPARIAAGLMILAAYLTGLDGKSALRIFRRDRYNHASPNSAQTEAVCAGALNVQLAGNASYFGKVYEKPTIGDSVRPVENEDIPRSCRLLYGTAILCLLGCVIVTGVMK